MKGQKIHTSVYDYLLDKDKNYGPKAAIIPDAFTWEDVRTGNKNSPWMEQDILKSIEYYLKEIRASLSVSGGANKGYSSPRGQYIDLERAANSGKFHNA